MKDRLKPPDPIESEKFRMPNVKVPRDGGTTKSLFQLPLPDDCLADALPADAREAVLKRTPNERAEFVLNVELDTQAFVQATQSIEALMQRTGVVSQPGGLCITGDGGAGKTFIFDAISTRHPRAATLLTEFCPVARVRLGSMPTADDFVQGLLEFLGHALKASAAKSEKRTQILCDALRECGTRVILVDEAHHMIPASGSRRNRDRLAGGLGDYAKEFYDESHIPIVWAGKPGLGDLFADDGQLNSRWPGKVSLPGYPPGNEWLRLLRALDQALPMEKPCQLDSPPVAAFLHSVTLGNLRRLKLLLSECVKVAAEVKGVSLTEDHFREASRRLSMSPLSGEKPDG
ncbi:TniB family NTP-binding protein [Paraburkholderia xenovorans]|uniref:TniB family NTP-binding protein n=1 Tax=Paraburkholderia xenovorans TaxID=36873 RepID=UPI001558A9D4|nr:TniB family NTP-binding protein [Paraburkholderia xenovorans]